MNAWKIMRAGPGRAAGAGDGRKRPATLRKGLAWRASKNIHVWL